MNWLHRYIVPVARGDSNGSDRLAAHAWSQIYSFGERVIELEVTFLLNEVCMHVQGHLRLRQSSQRGHLQNIYY